MATTQRAAEVIAVTFYRATDNPTISLHSVTARCPCGHAATAHLLGNRDAAGNEHVQCHICRTRYYVTAASYAAKRQEANYAGHSWAATE